MHNVMITLLPLSLFTTNVIVVINRTRKDSYEKAHELLPFDRQSSCRLRHLSRYILWDHATHARPTASNAWIISHSQSNQSLMWNSHSGSFKVTHLRIIEKPSRGCISCIYSIP